MKIKVKPVLLCSVYKRREMTSWRPWGGIQTEDDVEDEAERIKRDLEELASKADFDLEILPLSVLRADIETPRIEDIRSSDILLVYAAGGEGRATQILRALISNKPSILFVRHKSGPLYLWYEIAHPILIRGGTDRVSQPWISTEDVVVDRYDEVLWRLRAYFGLKNTIGRRVISIGDPGGWGIGGKAVSLAKLKWNLDIRTVSYDEISERIHEAKSRKEVIKEAQRKAEEYLAQDGVTLHTRRNFVINAFILYKVFKDLLNELQAEVITVSECMTTIMPIAETTACLTLSLLNDEGYLAFCESDFVVIPAGILLHYISGKPVFLNDPTYPHDGIVTLAHCTAPRKMDGEHYEKTEILTHFESDYGAAPKVNFRKGQEVTVIVPDFNEERWVGFKGEVLENPHLPICRSQVEIRIKGDWKTLLKEMRGFHWMMAYGDYLDEVGYALSKVKIEWKVIE